MVASRRFLLVVLVSGFDDKMHINSTSSACIMSKTVSVMTLGNCFSLYIASVHSAVKMSTCMAIDSGGYVYE